ncbi:hypothetical protein ADUPG1_013790, partial [Aduncisulcus paluster]
MYGRSSTLFSSLEQSIDSIEQYVESVSSIVSSPALRAKKSFRSTPPLPKLTKRIQDHRNRPQAQPLKESIDLDNSKPRKIEEIEDSDEITEGPPSHNEEYSHTIPSAIVSIKRHGHLVFPDAAPSLSPTFREKSKILRSNRKRDEWKEHINQGESEMARERQVFEMFGGPRKSEVDPELDAQRAEFDDPQLRAPPSCSSPIIRELPPKFDITRNVVTPSARRPSHYAEERKQVVRSTPSRQRLSRSSSVLRERVPYSPIPSEDVRTPRRRSLTPSHSLPYCASPKPSRRHPEREHRSVKFNPGYHSDFKEFGTPSRQNLLPQHLLQSSSPLFRHKKKDLLVQDDVITSPQSRRPRSTHSQPYCPSPTSRSRPSERENVGRRVSQPPLHIADEYQTLSRDGSLPQEKLSRSSSVLRENHHRSDVRKDEVRTPQMRRIESTHSQPYCASPTSSKRYTPRVNHSIRIIQEDAEDFEEVRTPSRQNIDRKQIIHSPSPVIKNRHYKKSIQEGIITSPQPKTLERTHSQPYCASPKPSVHPDERIDRGVKEEVYKDKDFREVRTPSRQNLLPQHLLQSSSPLFRHKKKDLLVQDDVITSPQSRRPRSTHSQPYCPSPTSRSRPSERENVGRRVSQPPLHIADEYQTLSRDGSLPQEKLSRSSSVLRENHHRSDVRKDEVRTPQMRRIESTHSQPYCASPSGSKASLKGIQGDSSALEKPYDIVCPSSSSVNPSISSYQANSPVMRDSPHKSSFGKEVNPPTPDPYSKATLEVPGQHFPSSPQPRPHSSEANEHSIALSGQDLHKNEPILSRSSSVLRERVPKSPIPDEEVRTPQHRKISSSHSQPYCPSPKPSHKIDSHSKPYCPSPKPSARVQESEHNAQADYSKPKADTGLRLVHAPSKDRLRPHPSPSSPTLMHEKKTSSSSGQLLLRTPSRQVLENKMKSSSSSVVIPSTSSHDYRDDDGEDGDHVPATPTVRHHRASEKSRISSALKDQQLKSNSSQEEEIEVIMMNDSPSEQSSHRQNDFIITKGVSSSLPVSLSTSSSSSSRGGKDNKEDVGMEMFIRQSKPTGQAALLHKAPTLTTVSSTPMVQAGAPSIEFHMLTSNSPTPPAVLFHKSSPTPLHNANKPPPMLSEGVMTSSASATSLKDGKPGSGQTSDKDALIMCDFIHQEPMSRKNHTLTPTPPPTHSRNINQGLPAIPERTSVIPKSLDTSGATSATPSFERPVDRVISKAT